MVRKEMPMHHTERETWRLRQASSPGYQSWWAAHRVCISISFDFFFTSWCLEWGVSSERPRACGRNARMGLETISRAVSPVLCGARPSWVRHLLSLLPSALVCKEQSGCTRWWPFSALMLLYIYVCACSVIFNPLWSHGMHHAKLLCPWDFPGKNTEVCCHFLLQRIFLT